MPSTVSKSVLVTDPDGVLDIDLERNAGASLAVELADLGDGLEDVAREVLLDQQQQHVALGLEAQAKEGRRFLGALATRLVDDRRAGGTGFARGVQHLVGLVVLDEGDDQLEMHGQSPSFLARALRRARHSLICA
jgi:hypothetical protein